MAAISWVRMPRRRKALIDGSMLTRCNKASSRVPGAGTIYSVRSSISRGFERRSSHYAAEADTALSEHRYSVRPLSGPAARVCKAEESRSLLLPEPFRHLGEHLAFRLSNERFSITLCAPTSLRTADSPSRNAGCVVRVERLPRLSGPSGGFRDANPFSGIQSGIPSRDATANPKARNSMERDRLEGSLRKAAPSTWLALRRKPICKCL